MISICIFEDQHYKSLLPITFGRACYDILLGSNRLISKICHFFSHSNVSLHCRAHLKPLLKSQYPDYPINTINIGTPCMFINGRLAMNETTYQVITNIKSEHNYIFTHQGQLVAAYLQGELLEFMRSALEQVPHSKDLIHYLRTKTICKELSDVHLLSDPWDPIYLNLDYIQQDFLIHNQPGIIKASTSPFTAIYDENHIFIDKNTRIEDFVTISAKNGPVYIEKNVTIESHSRLEGPLFIGEGTHILGGKIKQSSIGPHCKIAGEVSHCVIAGYSNKAHSGFIGHSYIGEWVNLGAQTTISNLKNNYNTVKVHHQNGPQDSGMPFLGAMIGDHCKTSINTAINSGTIIGYGSVLLNTTTHHQSIPPFSWGTANQYTRHDLKKFLETAKAMMHRRKKELHPFHEDMIHYLYNQTLHNVAT
ncbi:MAG: hypothetical protein CL521_02515 [Actinobacteria bacterium]|nr:hypothetical protein [Actinomycetota bacterium]